MDSGAVRNLIWPVGVAPVLESDKHIGSLPMTLAGGPSDEGLLWSSGEVRKTGGKYDQLISLGRLVHRGASVAWNSEHFQLWIPNRTLPIIATVEDYCPWIGLDDTAELREFMREDRTHPGGSAGKRSNSSTEGFNSTNHPKLHQVILSTSKYVNYYQFSLDELEDRFLASEEGVRKFLHGFLKLSELRTGGESEFTLFQTSDVADAQPNSTALYSFEPVKDKVALLKRLKESGPILVSTKDTANLQKAPLRRSVGGPDWTPKPGFDSFVQADLHFVGKEAYAYDGSHAIWIFIIHRKRLASDKNIAPRGKSCYNTLVLGMPVLDETQAGLENALADVQLLVDLGRFHLKMEREKSTGLTRSVSGKSKFTDYITKIGGAFSSTIPFRHPAFEVYVGIVQRQIRSIMRDSTLPICLWPEGTRTFNYVNLRDWDGRKLVLTPYLQNLTFHERLLGNIGYFKPERKVSGQFKDLNRSSMHPRGVPCICMAPRLEGHYSTGIIYAKEKTTKTGPQLVFTTIDGRGFQPTPEKGFLEQWDNLQILKQLKAPFDTVEKKTENPANISCRSCLNEQALEKGEKSGRTQIGRGRTGGHTLTSGCCYRQQLSLSNIEVQLEKPSKPVQLSQLQDALDLLLQPSSCSFQSLSNDQSIETRTNLPEIPQPKTYPVVGDPHWYSLNESPRPETVFTDGSPFSYGHKRIVNSVKGDKSLIEVFQQYQNNTLISDMSDRADEVQSAVLFQSMQDDFIRQLEHQRANEMQALKRQDLVENTQFYAVVINTKDASFLAQDPAVEKAIIAGDNKEISALLEEKVVRLATLDEIRERRQTEQILVIPSLVVRTFKPLEERYKSRLVACGNCEVTEEEKKEGGVPVYAPVVELALVKAFLLLALSGRGSACALDIKEAFTQTTETSSKEVKSRIQGHEKETVFLRLPSAWKSKLAPDLIHSIPKESWNNTFFEVLKSIYGLSTAPLAWFATFRDYLVKDLKFQQSQYDESFFWRISPDGYRFVCVLVYVDDVWVLGTWTTEVHRVESELTKRFRTTNPIYLFGPPVREGDKQVKTVPSFLTGDTVVFITNEFSVEYDQKEDTYVLKTSQLDYVASTLQKLEKKGCLTLAQLPRMDRLDPKFFVHQHLFEETDQNKVLTTAELTQLRSVVNSLGYLSSTRPDILSALGTVARGQAAGRQRHLEGARRIAAYVNQHARIFRTSVTIRDIVPKDGLPTLVGLDVYFDANLTSDQFARLGYFVGISIDKSVSCGSIAFRSGLSTTTCQSTQESELASCNFSCRGAESIANVLREVLTPQPGFLVKNTILKGDNSSANLFSSASSGTRNVRHLSLTQFYVRSLSTKGKILIRGIPSAENSSDLLTKVLDEPNLIRLLSYIGCISA